jgi:aldose 1-epimerase
VSVLNLGGVITGIFAPDRKGKYQNIILGYADINDYLENEAYYGAVIGRFAGRIYGGAIELDRRVYELERNNLGVNTLHGGPCGWHSKLWEVRPFEGEKEVGLVLECTSADGEAGFPGEVKATVKYILNNSNELYFVVAAETDKTTVVNVANHTYFNLSGDLERNILKHKLKIEADQFLELSSFFVPTGKALTVKETPFDFRAAKEIGQDLEADHPQLKAAGGYDHPFLFGRETGRMELMDERSGRGLTVTTNNPCVVLYTTNFPVARKLYNGRLPEKRMGICLETQNPPIGVGGCFREGSILKPGQVYRRWTRYKFHTGSPG